MPNTSDIAWFKKQFGDQISAAVQGTAFDLDMLTAVACQETGYIWQRLRKLDLSVEKIVALCVGDTIDRQSVFPRSRAELEAASDGQKMFAIARAALEDMAQYVPGYTGSAKNPDKFCHGFGVFQYDIQFFKDVDPDYFLQKKYEDFKETLQKCVEELESAQQRAKLAGKDSLTDLQKAAVAIAYNQGYYDPQRGLKQGHKDDTGRFYGENFYSYLKLSRTVQWPDPSSAATSATPALPGTYKVISHLPLNLRSAPDSNAASLGSYRTDTFLSIISRNGDWALVDLDGNGYADGYMWADYLGQVA